MNNMLRTKIPTCIGWRHVGKAVDVDGELKRHLIRYPGTPHASAQHGATHINLLGKIIDLVHPTRRHDKVIQYLVRHTASFAEFEYHCRRLSGHWFVFLTINNDTRLYFT